MQQQVTSEPSSTAPNFAGLLAALAAPAAKREPAWNDDDLLEDVATLSYESALRAHQRYRSPEAIQTSHGSRSESAAAEPGSERVAPPTATAVPRAAASVAAALDRNVKCSSITIRLSKAECDQLRERAAEAGLTVSAYLRSCTLEVESLRAQVKEALAELRSAGSKAVSTAVPLPRRSLLQRLPQVFPAWRNGRSGAQA